MLKKMNSTVKCRFCKKEIEKDNAYKVGQKLYFCNKEHYLSQCNKDKYKSPKINKDGTTNSRRQLTDWIQNYYIQQGYDKHDINWQLITAQIKNQIDEYGFKYQGMLLTLKYMTEIKCMNLLDDRSVSVVSLIPFEYNNAKNNWLETENIKKEIDNFDFSDNEIIVKKSIDKEKKKVYNSIDMEKL